MGIPSSFIYSGVFFSLCEVICIFIKPLVINADSDADHFFVNLYSCILNLYSSVLSLTVLANFDVHNTLTYNFYDCQITILCRITWKLGKTTFLCLQLSRKTNEYFLIFCYLFGNITKAHWAKISTKFLSSYYLLGFQNEQSTSYIFHFYFYICSLICLIWSFYWCFIHKFVFLLQLHFFFLWIKDIKNSKY